jgi:hypothetical protein
MIVYLVLLLSFLTLRSGNLVETDRAIVLRQHIEVTTQLDADTSTRYRHM